jgi:hypothetical protein
MISKIFIQIKYKSGNIIIFFLPQGERKPLTFFVGVDNKENPHLAMDPDSMILFVSIAESWVESVLKKMAPVRIWKKLKRVSYKIIKSVPIQNVGE